VPAIAAIFPPVAPILAAIAHVLAAIAAILDPIAHAAVVPGVAAILAPVADVFAAIAPILASIADVLDPVAHPVPVRAIPGRGGRGQDGQRREERGRDEEADEAAWSNHGGGSSGLPAACRRHRHPYDRASGLAVESRRCRRRVWPPDCAARPVAIGGRRQAYNSRP
jgi:hypothetical protein